MGAGAEQDPSEAKRREAACISSELRRANVERSHGSPATIDGLENGNPWSARCRQHAFVKRLSHIFRVAIGALSCAVLPFETVAASNGTYHPLLMATMNGQVTGTPKPAFVEPWIFTNGEKIVMVHHYCAKLLTGKRVPLTRKEIGTHDRWLRAYCLGKGPVHLDGAPYSGTNNHGVELRVGQIRLDGVLTGGATDLALAKESQSRAWWNDFELSPDATVGFYVLSDDKNLLHQVVPSVEWVSPTYREIYAKVASEARRIVGTSDGYCAGETRNCTDGWYPRNEAARSPGFEGVPAPGIANAFVANLNGNAIPDLVFGLRVNSVLAGDSLSPFERSAWRGMAVVLDFGTAWLKGTVSAPSVYTDEDRQKHGNENFSDYSNTLFLPRVALRFGRCTYLATILSASEAQTNNLLVLPRQSKECRDDGSSRPYPEEY